MTRSLQVGQYTYLIISRLAHLTMSSVLDKSCGKNKKHTFNALFFFRQSYVYEILQKNSVARCRTQMAVWRMRITCWVPKVTNGYSRLPIDFALQQWFAQTRLIVTL